jgi:hypothetical protein
MLEKDKNQRFDIIEVENEIIRINDSVVNRLYINDVSESNNESSTNKVVEQCFFLQNHYTVVKKICEGFSTEVYLVSDNFDPTLKQLVIKEILELKLI